MTCIVPCPAAEYEKAESVANAVEERVKAVHAKIMEVSGGKVKAAQKKLDDATKKLEKVRWQHWLWLCTAIVWC